ncbi:substrate-specific activator of APC-dependent proteolysis [Coemansia furcata]|uniref:Substrate-specific activator of APC-dependent proteolysis n=1 Tax=Coemansia furcata TaxID=417177 RepID=A0ACC1LLX1_9FUNG|nr:substrate-specific activator of APC-dependent proteolysis [Coemansia furcata]
MLEDEIGNRVMRRRNNGRETETSGLRSQDARTSSSTRNSRSRSRARRQVTTSDAVAGGTVVRPKGGETRRGSRSVGPGVQPSGTINEARTQRLTRSQAANICAMAETQEMPSAKLSDVVDSGHSSSTSTRDSHSSRTRQRSGPTVHRRSLSESPTLLTLEPQSAAQSSELAAGVVTRSMARRLETHDGAPPIPLVKAIPLPTRIPLPPSATKASSPPPVVTPTRSASPLDSVSPPESTARHVRRSPQFNYDRFIPARAATDLRMYEPRAGSPTFSRRTNHVEHRAQVDEANRTYDALLRAELLRDRPAADDMDTSRRMRASSPPPPARSAARRDAYRLPSSPNPLPSLVPWSSSSNGNSSRPTTPPPNNVQRPVFMYKSPRKASAALAASAPAPFGRNLFGRASPVHDVYQQSPLAKESRRMLGSRTAPRVIPRDPIKVLDAPGIRDDYYLNLMDWSSDNRVSVALNTEVYVWDAASSQTTRLCDVGESGEWVTSVRWAESGGHLAVGLNTGAVQIWDTTRARCVRTFTGHTRRVGVLEWSSSVISSGSRDKRIHNRDSRMRESALISTYYAHTQEVCGLKWSPDRTQLASGGNDNLLLIWDQRFTPLDSRVHSDVAGIAPGARTFRRPLFRLAEHSAAVKALAWCPTRPALLASGGGTEDRCIRLWNTHEGTPLASHDTRSQVCNLSWSHDGDELVSTHGYSENHVVVWKYPAMHPIALLSGHTKRVLYLAHSPDGQTVATAAADETIRFWNVFPKSTVASAPTAALAALPSHLSTFPGSPIIAPVGGSGIMLDDLAHIR